MKLKYIGTDTHYVGTSIVLKRNSVHDVRPVKIVGRDLVLSIDGENLPVSLDNFVHEWDSLG